MNTQENPTLTLRETCARGLVNLAYNLKYLHDSVVDSVIGHYIALRKTGLESGLDSEEVRMYDNFLAKRLIERGGRK